MLKVLKESIKGLQGVFGRKGSQKSFYELRDKHYIAYDMSYLTLGDTRLRIRGKRPRIIKNGEYGVCLGAAQTFGCYCERPFPSLLQKKLKFPVINLGFGGSGASHFLANKDLMHFLNNAKFVIVQVMSARGKKNSMVNELGTQKYVSLKSDGFRIKAFEFYEALLRNEDNSRVAAIVDETRNNWVENMISFLTAIRTNKVLFWFSKRHANYEESFDSAFKLFGGYPQMVNQEMIDRVRPHADHYVECVTRRGVPQQLKALPLHRRISFFCDKVGHNKDYNEYYPSPEMHEDAANVLFPVCQRILAAKT